MFTHKIRHFLLASTLCLALTACGNDIKSDIILLDQAVTHSGMNDSAIQD